MKKQMRSFAVFSLLTVLSTSSITSALGRDMTDAEKKYKQMQLEKARKQQLMLQQVMGKVNGHMAAKKEVAKKKDIAHQIKMFTNELNSKLERGMKKEKKTDDIQSVRFAAGAYSEIFTQIKNAKNKHPYTGWKETVWDLVGNEKLDTVIGKVTADEVAQYAKKRITALGSIEMKACKGRHISLVEKPATKQKLSEDLKNHVIKCSHMGEVKDWRGRKKEMEKICDGLPIKRVSGEWETFTPSRGTAAEKIYGTELRMNVMCSKEVTTTAAKEYPTWFDFE